MRQDFLLRAILIILVLTVWIIPGFSQQPNIIFIYADDWGNEKGLNEEWAVTTGDYIEAEIELIIIPLHAEDYYGPNENLGHQLQPEP